MKKIIGIISAIIIGATSMHAMAADEIGVVLDGKKLTFDQNPVIKNDRTLVPFRGILEAMGAQVSWDGEAKKVTAKKIFLNMICDIEFALLLLQFYFLLVIQFDLNQNIFLHFHSRCRGLSHRGHPHRSDIHRSRPTRR